MRRTSLPGRLSRAAVLVALVSGACDPQPLFPANDPALTALDTKVFYEQEVVADGVRHRLVSYSAIFDIPADVAPLGTRFTLRLVGTKTLSPVDAADLQWFGGGSSKTAALVTPETISFASPILLTTILFPNVTSTGDIYVLRARSTDAAWTRGATLAPEGNVIPIDGGGLWSIAYQLKARP